MTAGQKPKPKHGWFDLAIGWSWVVGSVTGPWRTLASQTRQMPIADAFRGSIAKGVTDHADHPSIRFEREMSLSNLSENELSVIERRVTWRALLFSLFAVFSWAYLIYRVFGIISDGGPKKLLYVQGIYIVLAPLMFSVWAIIDHIRSYQIRTRQLVTAREWVQQMFHSQKSLRFRGGGRDTLVILLALAAGWLVSVHIAHAASAGGVIDVGQSSTQMAGAYGFLAHLGSTDLSGQWLARLFPSLTGGTGGMLADMLASFNSIVLDVGAGMVFWQGIQMLMHAAQRGTLDGSRYHVVYGPLRSLIGAGALVPALGGYCLIQAASLQVLGAGYWMADNLYSTMITATMSPAAMSAEISSIPVQGLSSLVENAIGVETCVAWYNNNQAADATVGYADPYSGMYSSNDTNFVTKAWMSPMTHNGTYSYAYNFSYCGTLSIGAMLGSASGARNLSQFSGAAAFDTSRTNAFKTYMGAVWSSGLPQALANEISANGGQLPTATTIAKLPTSATMTQDYGKVVAAGTTYLDSVRNDAKVLATSGLTSYATGLQNTGNNYGWASAGALFSAVSQMFTRAVGGIQSSVPTLTIPTLTSMSTSTKAHVQAAFQTTSNFMSSSLVPAAPTMTTTGGVVDPTPPSALGSITTASSAQAVLDEPSASLLFHIDNSLMMDPSNPIGSIVSEGSTLIYAGGTLIGIGMGAKLLGGILGGAAGAAASALTGGGAGVMAGALAHALSFALLIGEVLIAVGAFQTFVIPMLFYIAFLFQVVNSIAFAAEFVLSSPLAAFQFMKVSGQEPISEEQRAFFTIAFLNGFLRPSLLLFGLAISTYVLSAIAQVINSTFNIAIASSQGGSIIGPIGIFTFVLLLAYVEYRVSIMSVGLIGRVPDAVADLVGGYLGRLSSGVDESTGIGERAMGAARNAQGNVIKTVMQPKLPAQAPAASSGNLGG